MNGKNLRGWKGELIGGYDLDQGELAGDPPGMGMKDILDSSKWPAPVWAVAAGLLSWWSVAGRREPVTGHKDNLPVLVPPIAAGIALALATLVRAIGTRKDAQGTKQSGNEGGGGGKNQQFDARLLEEAKAHREWLHSSLQTVAWACGLVITAGLGTALWVLGESAHAAASAGAERILEDANWTHRLNVAIDKSISDTVPNRISSEITNIIGAQLDGKLAKLVSEDPKQLVRDFVANTQTALTPIGCVVAWPSSVKPPDGWEICDGRITEARSNERIL